MGRWADVTRLQTLSKAFILSELTLQNKTITSSLCYWTIRGKKRGGTFVSVVSNTALEPETWDSPDTCGGYGRAPCKPCCTDGRNAVAVAVGHRE